jgi:hypothetical protein
VGDVATQIGQELAAMIDASAETAEPEESKAGADGPETQIIGGLVRVEFTKTAKHKWQIALRRQGTGALLNQDQGDLSSANTRDRIIKKAIENLKSTDAGTLTDDLEQTLKLQLDQRLMQAAAASEVPDGGGAAPIASAVDYEAREDEDHPEATGYYAVGEKFQRRLSNFVVKFEEERIIGDADEAETSRSFRGTINCLGEVGPFEISSEEFSEKLRQAIHNAAGVKPELLGSVDEVRTAISRNSEPVKRQYLTSTGWTDDFSRYLVPGGYVDRDGYHEHVAGDGVPAIDLSDHEKARWIGLRQLDPARLRQVKQHILDDLMQLHDPSVIRSMLAVVVLSAMIRFAEVSSWLVLWFQGLTGSGKSFLACLGMNFFGDFGGQGSGRFISWKSTGKAIQSAGYYFRDVMYLVDDYKRDDVRHADAVMVIQGAADRTGRSRLNADASMNTTRWIRGTLLGTGEDYPDSNASGLGRTVIIRVPNPEKDHDRAQRCLSQCQHYRGWMAAFLAHVIRNDLGKQFKARVEHWHRHYHELIKNKANDARIATNHACLAAAFELFAGFMNDVWPGADHSARIFAEQYLRDLVVEAVGAVEEETPARIFLDTLGELIAFQRARVEGIGRIILSDDRDKDKIVGRLISGAPCNTDLDRLPEDAVIALSIPMAMRAVQEQLRGQGRQPLQTSARTLLDQLASLGFLHDEHNQPIAKDQAGEKTTKARIGGKPVNVARIKAEAILKHRPAKTATPTPATGAPEMPMSLPFHAGATAG